MEDRLTAPDHPPAVASGCSPSPWRRWRDPTAGGARGLPGRHAYEAGTASAAGLEGRFGVTFESMGYSDDPVYFGALAMRREHSP